MAILKHIASKSSNYGAALEYLIFKHDELRKTPILDQNGNRIMRDEFYLDGLNCEPYSFDAACQQLNREYQKNKNKNEIKSHHYIISFDPRDSTENCLTGKRAQELGVEYAKANFPGHQALVCTHMDGHNGSGNILVHIVINSLRKLDVPQQPFMERPIDCKAGYKHHVTNEYLKHLQKSLMDLCRREFLHQVDLLSPSRTGVTEAEYWAQRWLDEKKQEIEKEGFTPNPTKFQTQKQLIRDAVAAAREKAISYEDFQDILQDEYDVFVKTQRGRYSYLPPEQNKFISERSLGDSCKRECLEGIDADDAYFLTFVKDKPKFAYAVSLGANNAFEGEQGLKYINYIRNFKGISVREKNAQKWIEQATGKKELITLDPTMLFDQEEWEKIVEVKAEPIIPGKHIFYYCFGINEDIQIFLHKLSDRLQIPVYFIEAKEWTLKMCWRHKIYLVKQYGPDVYMNLVKYADLFITSSFHGTAFGTIYRKNFWYIKGKDSESSKDDRATTFLSQLGLMSRYRTINELETINLYDEIDYKPVVENLNELRIVSNQYLSNIVGTI